ncbi:SPOR domain-containing protein [Legionella fairfieldensis]|uniref:SPOR domain-containing protein n=1 Tax=Legionella fairfieldensis TaxID=45064 RepID=UPI00048ED2D8|nr:SPOR domain-containing protein [Legionella fairfieldensis]
MNKPIFLTGYLLGAFIFLNGYIHAGTNVWGLSNIHKVNSKSPAPYTVYIGAYVNYNNAQRMKLTLDAKGYKARIKRKRNLYLVYIGPITTLRVLHKLTTHTHNRSQVMVFKPTKPHHDKITTSVHSKQVEQIQSTAQHFKNDSRCKDCRLDGSKWFVQLQGGVFFPLMDRQILIDNGADVPAPGNVDIYSVKQSNPGTIALTVGHRMTTQLSTIDHYTFSGRLQYVLPANVGKTIMQYSIPEFLNYNYNWKLSALALTADTKLNLFNFSNFLPYINGGLGVSFNQARSYRETALPEVTPRVSPAYANHTLTHFTYHVGAGLDFFYARHWLLSVGYEFESLGDFSSGKGQSTWFPESLYLGTYQANTLLFSVTYLID